METFQTFVLILSAIALFIYGLQSFSKEIEAVGMNRLKQGIGKITRLPLGGFLLGGFVTAIIQSSTLVSSLTVSLVSSGILAFKDALLILLGTNIGTTSTAWIVTFQSSLFGPIFIVLGTLISMVPFRFAIIGKSIFYFGFIFFSLSYISQVMAPVRDNPVITEWLAKASNPLLGILYGIVITVIIQSSSVVVGLVIVLIGQHVISLDAAIPIVIGANIGTTSTALLVSFRLGPLSKLTALSASTFNLVGVLLVLPLLPAIKKWAIHLFDDPAMQVAAAFTICNTITSFFFLVFFKPTINQLKKHRWYKQSFPELKKE